MSTTKANDDLYDLDNVPSTENTGPALIEKAGITHNLSVAVHLKEGDYKKEDRKGEKWHGFEVVLTDPTGLQLTELYFQPPQNAEEVHDKLTLKKYELSEGKLVETRDQTKQEALKTLNNEFMAFLIDLGEAMGFNQKDVEQHLFKAAKEGKGFQGLCQAFIDKFKPKETTRISAKLLFENNKNKETSFLKAHGSYCVYFPYGNDLFDTYKEGRPTVLKLTKYEQENKLVKKYTGTSDAPKDAGNGITKTAGGFKAADLGTDDDPF